MAPASPPDPYEVYRGATKLQELGFRVVFGGLVRKLRMRGYFAGTDAERAASVNRAFADPEVHGIVAAAGGYGSLRILDGIDYDLVRANPKVFLGFSDVTALQIAIQQESEVVTFHGPMANLESEEHWNDFTERNLLAAIGDPARRGPVPTPSEGPLIRVVNEGSASGVLVGGNLSLVCATLGTPWEIDTRGKVLFLEDWKEPPFTIDTYLTQLRLAGKFREAAAIVFGEFIDCFPTDKRPNFYVEEIVQDVCEDFDGPVLYGIPSGHGRHNATLPLGVRVTVDGEAGDLVLEEGAVTAPPREPAPPPAAARRRPRLRGRPKVEP